MEQTKEVHNMIFSSNNKLDWNEIPHTIKTFPAKHTLLEAGKTSNKLFVIKKGAIRLWFNNEGKDITLQFFFEDTPVCSFESFINETPSEFYIETLEPTTALVIDKPTLLNYGQQHPNKKEIVLFYLINRLTEYTHLFLSRIKDTPQQRYNTLIHNRPDIIQRIPQHYIASYLGITSVSLSRIRARK
jgi:CRP-like cAMP-binding protein